MTRLTCILVLLASSLLGQNKGYLPMVSGTKPVIFSKADPNLRDSLFEIKFAVNLYAFGDAISDARWNNISVGSGFSLGEYSSDLVGYDEAPTTADFHVISVPEFGTWSNSTDTVPTSPSVFPSPTKDRGAEIADSYDTIGVGISGLLPNTLYHLSMYVRSKGSGSDIFRVITAVDTFDFKDAILRTRSYEVPIETDPNGFAYWYILPYATNANDPALTFQAFYIRDFNASYVFSSDNIDDAPPSSGGGGSSSIPVIEDWETYTRASTVLDVNDFKYFYDQYHLNNVETYADSTGYIDSIYENSFDQAFAIDQWVFDGTQPIGVKPNATEKGDMLNFISKSAMRYPWNKEGDFKYYTDLDSIGFFDDGTFSPHNGYFARWLEVQGRTSVDGPWITLVDSIAYTNTNTWKFYKINTDDSLVSIKLIRHRKDIAGFLTNLYFREKILMSLYGDKGTLIPDFPPLLVLGSDSIDYRTGKGSNNLVTTQPSDFSPYLETSRMYNDWANFVLYESYTDTNLFIVSPYGFGSSKALGGIVDSAGLAPMQIRYYLQDENRLDQYRDNGDFQIFLIQNKIRNRTAYNASTNSEFLITEDSTLGAWYQDGEYTLSYIGRPATRNFAVELFNAVNDTGAYDLPKDTINGVYQSYLPSFSDLASSSIIDSLGGARGYASNAFYNAMPVDNVFDAFSNWAYIDKRDSALLAAGTWDNAMSLAFVVTGIMGRNDSINRDHLEKYLYPGQLYQTGLNVINAIALAQEANKTWEGAAAHFRAMWYGMFMSYVYDGHLASVPGVDSLFAMGIWPADPNMMLSFGADLALEGDFLMEAYRWMMYFRRQRWNTLVLTGDTLHPYNNLPMRLLPKMHFDVHHYPTSSGGQSASDVDLLDPNAKYSYAIAPEDMHWEKFERTMRWAQSDEVADDCRRSVSEYAYGGNDGAPASLRIRDIGRRKPGMENYIECAARRWIDPDNPEESCGKDSLGVREYKLNYEVFEMVFAPNPSSSDVDSTIGYGYGYAMKALDYRLEMAFTAHGCPRFEYFTFSELGYPTPRTTADTGYYYLVGVPSAIFTYMGLYNSYNFEFTTGTYAWRNITATMGNFVLSGYDVNDSMVTCTYYNKEVANEYATAVWKRGVKNDTLHNVVVPFPVGATNVVQHQPFIPELGSKQQVLGDVPSSTEDILIMPKFFIYTKE